MRIVPEEAGIAFVYGGATEAVMLATPCDLEDFGIGFSLTEGIVETRDEIVGMEIVRHELGTEIRMELSATSRDNTTARRRHRAGPAGCGLCGIESLESAMRRLPKLQSGIRIAGEDVLAGMSALTAAQSLNRQTRAVHAAGFYMPGDASIVVREDVGRHNALDKVAGALARAHRNAQDGIVLLTSRISVELVQKAAMMGATIVAAISAPTALALRVAGEAGICVIGIVREDGFEVFTHPQTLQS
ncbi:MAG TPA: formate dehydrogenase accessory sulfurtransferase FdhD [Rhizomicrobium sp.]